MVQIKLIKGLSYSGIVNATIKNPLIVTDEDTAKKAVETGYFAIVEVVGINDTPPAIVPPIKEPTGEKAPKPVNKMTKPELEAYAEEKGIDISECTTNDQRVALIKEIEDKVEESNLTPAFTSGE